MGPTLLQHRPLTSHDVTPSPPSSNHHRPIKAEHSSNCHHHHHTTPQIKRRHFTFWLSAVWQRLIHRQEAFGEIPGEGKTNSSSCDFCFDWAPPEATAAQAVMASIEGCFPAESETIVNFTRKPKVPTSFKLPNNETNAMLNLERRSRASSCGRMQQKYLIAGCNIQIPIE
ncbi:hypothetical protein AKJ16_DCAP24860 [Drosera capensis]